MQAFKCICTSGSVPEEVVKTQLDETQYRRLQRIRLSRIIDANPNMVWCTNLKCEKEVERIGNARKLECTYCGQLVCFKCQLPWHEGRLCDRHPDGGLKCLNLFNDVRRCPQCRIAVEKEGGCTEVSCQRCNYYYCWCCMGPYNDLEHNKWYKLCPRLPYSFCINLIITFLFIIFLPVVITVGPLLAIIHRSTVWLPHKITQYWNFLFGKILIYALCILILTPVAIVLGMAVVAIIDAFVILPCYYYSISFFIRLSIVGCRTKI